MRTIQAFDTAKMQTAIARLRTMAHNTAHDAAMSPGPEHLREVADLIESALTED